MENNPILVAIDTKDMGKARTLCRSLNGVVGGVKLGLEFIFANGIKGVNEIAELGVPIFLDTKFFDIPNTVSGAVSSVIRSMNNIFMMNIHCLGGSEMMQRAVESIDEATVKYGKKRPLLIGVSILTSMSMPDMNEVGIDGLVQDEVLKLARLAKESGLDGLVCSPLEVYMLKQELGYDFKLIVPGIRPEVQSEDDFISGDDQKRILTPEKAMEKGADYLVIGRPINGAEDPREKAIEIAKSVGVEF
jgi:orotidine-5'-phosphate decarboxylase